MDYRDQIISAVANRECARVARKVIHFLQKTSEGMQSGDDSPLKNLWDEVCVQVQGQESVLREVYVEVIEQSIAVEVQKLPETTKQAIWLQTNNGSDWACDQEEDRGYAPYDEQDIIDHILTQYVLSQAADYSNSRIREYHERTAEDNQ